MEEKENKTVEKEPVAKEIVKVAPIEQRIITATKGKIDALMSAGFRVPEGYDVSKELRAAVFQIQTVVDKDKRPALQVCTEASICESLFKLIVEGMSCTRGQVYFIVRGNELTYMRSYFGDIAVCRQIDPTFDINAMVIHEGDKFGYDVVDGNAVNIRHESSFENIDKPILGCYAIYTYQNGEKKKSDILTWRMIQSAWAKSSSYNHDVHKAFPDDMSKRTMIKHACKAFLRSQPNGEEYARIIEDADDLSKEQPAQEEYKEIEPAKESKEREHEHDFVVGEGVEPPTYTNRPKKSIEEHEVSKATPKQTEELFGNDRKGEVNDAGF